MPGHRPTILLLTEERKDQRTLAKALGATGCRVHVVGSIQEAELCLGANEIDLLVSGYDPISGADFAARAAYDAFLRRVASLPAHWTSSGKINVLLLAEKRGKSELGTLFRFPFLTNLIAKSHPLDLDEVIITVGKIVHNDIFGIDKYLCYGVQPVTHEVRSSRDKGALLQSLASYASGLGIHNRLITVAENVADELIMNAVYNAPIAADGSKKYASRSRSEELVLQPHEVAWFTYACDGRQLVIAMRDRFGSLTAETVRDYLGRCFAMGDDQIEVKPGGAGMGLYFIVEALNKIIINISPGHGTEVIGVIDISGSYRTYAEKYKSFHIFVG